MTTIAEINAERDKAIALLQEKLNQAVLLKNGGAAGMDPIINDIALSRADVAAQAYAKELDSPTMAAALAALKGATSEMNTVASVMVSATTFISQTASLLTAVNKVITALK